MGKKQTFAKLTEDLGKLEEIEKSEEPKVVVEEPVVPVVEPEVVEPAKEEPKAEEPKAEEPVAEEVEKSKKDDKKDAKAEDDKEDEEDEDKDEDDKEDKKDAKAEGKKDAKAEGKKDAKAEDKKDDKKKEDKEPVKKSENSEDEVSEADFLGAFEAVIKSYSGVKAELAELKKSLSDILSLVQKPAEVVEEPVAKSAEEPKAEEPAEELEKSVEQPEEELEGKAIEYVSKSNGVPEIPAEEEPVAEEPAAEFNPVDHVKQVTEYFMKNATSLTQGQKAAYRGAVNRVKRGEGTETDIDLFKQVSEFYENSEN